MQNICAAVIQMVSGTDASANIRAMGRLVRLAAERGAQWAVLPEYWPLMGRHDTDKLAQAEQFGRGPLQIFMAELAARHRDEIADLKKELRQMIEANK